MSNQVEDLAPHIADIARALANRVELEQIEDELKRYVAFGVPLAQAKRDIVRNHGGSLRAGKKRLADVVAGDSGLELLVKVVTVNPKDIVVQGEPRQIFYGFLADESGKVPYTAWKDLSLERGAVYELKNAYAKAGYRSEGIEINLGDYVTLVKTNATLNVVDTPFGDGARAAPTERKVGELADGQSSVTVFARILSASPKTVSGANGPRELIEGELADETGKVQFTAWSPATAAPLVKPGAVVRIANAYVKAWRGVPQLNFGENARIEALPANSLPSADELARPHRLDLGAVEKVGGASSVLIEGVLLEVKKGSGLVFRCPTCNRVLQKRECRLHGKVEGIPDLRVKAVLDDGRGAATLFLGRDATERLLGKTLAEAQAQARDAMTVDVVQDDLVAKLTARRLLVFGNVTSDEFGLQIIAREAELAPLPDIRGEAERLLARVAEVA